MRFALLGNHPDGLALAKALAATGRHHLAIYSGPRPDLEDCRQFAPEVQAIGDLEEVLADPSVEAVIVASRPGHRAGPLRRALQSERAVLCVHPADDASAAYEAGMIQADTKQVLLPLLVEAFHPGIARLIEAMRSAAVGNLRLVELEVRSKGEVVRDIHVPGHDASLPGWQLLRRLGGEVAEVSAMGQGEEPTASEPLLVSGRFQSGGLFQVKLLPNQADDGWSARVLGAHGSANLELPADGSASLTWNDAPPDPAIVAPGTVAARQGPGLRREQTWPAFDRWAALVDVFESARQGQPGILSWQDEIRGLELDDAARRSLERRRASSMEYQEASEVVGFKGTMTLIGCGLLWGILVVLILSAWVPWLGWAIAPLLAIFLGLQLLRWLIPKPTQGESETGRGQAH